MATQTITRTLCDRCKKVVHETDPDKVDDEPQDPPPNTSDVIIVDARGIGREKQIRYNTLCDSCKERVNDLLDDIALTKKPKAKAAKDEPAAGAAPATEPKDPPAEASAPATDDKKDGAVDTDSTKEAAQGGKRQRQQSAN